MSLPKRIVQACAEMEGFFVTEEEAKKRGIRYPTAAQRHNNPGNIMDLGFYRQTKRFRLETYPTVEAGFAAAEAWWGRRIREGKTLREAIHIYAPQGHGANDPEAYAAFVAGAVGIPPDVPLSQLPAEQQQ